MELRPFADSDADAVCELFVRVNRLLAPASMAKAFEDYVALAIREEIGRVEAYYREHLGGFWVAVDGDKLVGMFGLEPASGMAMELRRMYVDPDFRRRGIARALLHFAENECRRRGCSRMELSTSDLQQEALAFYQASGYWLVREEIAASAGNKTVGGGIRRYHFSKHL